MVNAENKSDGDLVHWWRAVPLFALMGLLLLLDLAIATFLPVDSDIVGPVIGAMFAQIVVAAVWIPLGPMSLFTRMIVGVPIIIVATFCMFMCAVHAGDREVAFVLAAAMLVQAVLYQLPLWVARRYGWRLSLPTAEVQTAVKYEFQFGIRQLLILTTVVAVLLAGGRLLLPGFSFILGEFQSESITLFLVFSLFNVLIAFPIIWGCFVHRFVWIWLLLAVVWCCILTPVELWILESYARGAAGGVFVMLNFAQLISAATVLLCLRLIGLRLRHQSAPEAAG